MTRNINRGPIPDDLGWLVDDLADIFERLRTLEAPDGSQIAQTVATLQAIVEDIQAQIDAWAAGRWTNAQIEAQIDAKIAAMLAGNVAIAGSLDVAGAVRLPGAAATDLVAMGGARTQLWIRTGGPGDAGHT